MITVFEFLNFTKQVGFALVGAASMWALYFYYKTKYSSGEAKEVYSSIIRRFIAPVTVGVLMSVIAWFGLDFTTSYIAFAHEGITIAPERGDILAALEVREPVFLLFVFSYLAGVLVWIFKKELFLNKGAYFYAWLLFLSTVLISLPAWNDSFTDMMFFIWHNNHSILTLGTVLVLDFLLLVTKYHEKYERHIYPILPIISKVIWLGLFLDFFSVAFVFERAIENTAKFQIMQTVVGVLIVNGIFLSGPLTRKMQSMISSDGTVTPMTRKWELIASVSGSISIASWITITFTDFIQNITVGYTTLLGIYVGFIIVAWMSYEVLEQYKVGSRW